MHGWQIAELQAHVYFANKGYRILIDIADSSAFDFVALKGDTFLRVNVKLATLKDKTDPTSWGICRPTNRSGTVHEPDLYVVWVPNTKSFIELPGNFLSPCKSGHRRIPKKLLP